jgi:hypothetical protein
MHGVASELIAAILRFADGQRGLITYEQLVRCGLDAHGIKRLVRRGWLRPVHRGVYLVGHAAAVPFVRETAAFLAYNPRALISDRSSLALWRLCATNDALGIHVTVLGRKAHSRPGVIVHQVATLHECDIGHCERLPVTMPARALLESACDLGLHETEKAVDEALALNLVSRPGLLAVIERYPKHRGAAILRKLADPDRASEITHSVAAKRYGRLLRKADAPPSESEYPIGPYSADRCWVDLNLVVEIDGVQFHRDRKRMESDNKRQDYLRHHGHAVTRFTRRQVMYEPEYVLFRTGVEIGLAMAKIRGP